MWGRSKREFGMSVFESAEYGARNRSDHWYVYDLYKTYLMRDPDPQGWAWWQSRVPEMGREQLRHAFHESVEFNNIVATLTASGSPSAAVSSLATARVDPFNQTGDQIRARDCEWGVGILSLPGRAGLDLGLSLSYSSLVWTRSGPYLYFDEDRGSPSPGFRLGFATIRGPYFDAQLAKNVYVLVTSSGRRVELRQVGTSNVYEAGDSSYLQLIAGGSPLLRTADGTQISFSSSANGWRATLIEDSNGNYLSVNYDWRGDLATVTDTLGRVINFNYDANANLSTITQVWQVNGLPQTHVWASFGWGTQVLQPPASGLSAVGIRAGESVPVLSQVGLDDGTRYNFEYNESGQVQTVRRYTFDGSIPNYVERARVTYLYATPADDCPRVYEARVWAENWTGVNGVPAEVVTGFDDPGDGSREMTAPDGTVYKEIYGTGWQKGLTIRSEVRSGGALQKQTFIEWTQDDTPTTLTDADGFSSYVRYNFDFGARTRFEGPPPAGQPNGLIQTFTYDGAARLERVTTTNNGAYTRYFYGPNYLQQFSTVNTVADEAYSAQSFAGLGRVIAASANHPGSAGGYRAQVTQYDRMGRAVKRSNPTEINGGWNPSGDDAAGWVYTQQTYDWQGRPRITTNTDGTQRGANYEGCGCAGGAVVTLTDEMGRQRKVHSDALGRRWKTEVLNWDGSVYLTLTNSLDALDRVKFARHYEGMEQSGVYREASMTYDGYGRLQSRRLPEQDAGAATLYTYNADDIPATVTDARGAVTAYSYNNNRHLVSGITHTLTGSATLTYGYAHDAAGNRTSMTTGGTGGTVTYHYDSLSRLTSEDRQLPGLSGTYTLGYEYALSGQLRKVTDAAADTSLTYGFDAAGQLRSLTGIGFEATGTAFVTGMEYRAWGALKGVAYGNQTSLSLSYDARGLPTHYGVNGVTQDGQYGPTPHGSDFQFYADGRIKYAADLFTGALVYGSYKMHDRAYSYDHAGRLQEAYSGNEAVQFMTGVGVGAEGAYRQSYGYDTWGEMTSRVGRFWTEADNNTEAYAAGTGRHAAPWEYDADGRLVSRNEAAPDTLPYVPLRQTYDAAGRPSQTTQTTSWRDPFNQSVHTDQLTRTKVYDGDGAVVKEAAGGGADYYLRSSVLGGRVVAEYDGAGTRKNSYVVAGGSVVARKKDAALYWRQVNPVTGDELETDAQGAVAGKAALDPMGVALGDNNPFEPTAGGGGAEGLTQAEMNQRYAQLLPPSMGGSGPRVRVDGFETAPLLASAVLSSGSGGLAPLQTVRWNPNVVNDRGPRGGYEFYRVLQVGSSGDSYSGWMTEYGYSHWDGDESFYNSRYDDYHEIKSWLTKDANASLFLSLQKSNTVLTEKLRAVLETAIDACLKKLSPVLSLGSFVPTEKEKNGKINVVGGDWKVEDTSTFTVHNDVTSHSSVGLGNLKDQHNGRPMGETNSHTTVLGYTRKGDASGKTYTARDRGLLGGGQTPGLTDLVGPFIETQLHELARALGNRMRGNGDGFNNPDKAYPGNAGKDFTDCVLKEMKDRRVR